MEVLGMVFSPVRYPFMSIEESVLETQQKHTVRWDDV
jgi:hypothetical protein